jgi:hypothetical protein
VVRVRLEPVALVVQVDHVRLVPVEVHLVRASVAHVQAALQVGHRVEHQDLLVQAAAQVQVAVAALAVELPERSVRAAAREARLASRSARNAKSMSRDRHLALVERLFHAATAPLLFACVADQASKISQTRLMQTQVS